MSEMQSINLKKQDKAVAWIVGIIGFLLLASVGYGLFLLMPLLVELAKNTIIFFVELAVLVSMLVGVLSIWNERELFIYKWKNFVRNLRRAIVREDPIGVLDTAIRRFATRLESIDEKIAEAVGAKKTQINKQREAESKAENSQGLFLAARNKGESEAVQGRHAIASQRYADAAKKMQPMVDLLTNMQISFQAARDLADNTMKDLMNQRDVLKIELEASKAGQSAVKSFKKFFGASNESDMAMMAFDEIERQTNEAEAEIEQFMRVMDPALKDEELKKSAEAISAMNRMAGFISKKELGPAIEAEVLHVNQTVSTRKAQIG